MKQLLRAILFAAVDEAESYGYQGRTPFRFKSRAQQAFIVRNSYRSLESNGWARYYERRQWRIDNGFPADPRPTKWDDVPNTEF